MRGHFFYWTAKADAYAFGYVRSAYVMSSASLTHLGLNLIHGDGRFYVFCRTLLHSNLPKYAQLKTSVLKHAPSPVPIAKVNVAPQSANDKLMCICARKNRCRHTPLWIKFVQLQVQSVGPVIKVLWNSSVRLGAGKGVGLAGRGQDGMHGKMRALAGLGAPYSFGRRWKTLGRRILAPYSCGRRWFN